VHTLSILERQGLFQIHTGMHTVLLAFAQPRAKTILLPRVPCASQPFFEADLPGCVLRIVPNLGPNAPRSQQPQYMLVRVDSVVQRNSYT